MFGFTIEETNAPDFNFMNLVAPQSKPIIEDRVHKLSAGEKLDPVYEFAALNKEGENIECETSVTYIDYKGGKAVQGIIRDITERKLAEKELERVNEELNTKNKELEQILYVTSHDLRSPLVNIQGFSRELDISIGDILSQLKEMNIPKQLDKKYLFVMEEDIPEALNFILKSVEKMDSLLHGLLKLSRLGRHQLKLKIINMNKLIKDVLSTVEFEIKEKKIEVNVTRLPNCLADDMQINQVFSNLINNAIKFMSPKRTGKIHISGNKKADRIFYSIEDNGEGIDANHQKKIFNLFHQLDPSKPGEGIGLTLVKRILELHGGSIELESKFNKGSVFTVILPAWALEQ